MFEKNSTSPGFEIRYNDKIVNDYYLPKKHFIYPYFFGDLW